MPNLKSVEFETKLEKFSAGLSAFHIKVPEEHIDTIQAWRKDRRVEVLIGKHPSYMAAVQKYQTWFYITVNKSRIKEFGLEPGEVFLTKLQPSSNAYGIEVPEVFMAVLETDELAKYHFDKLSPGKQRSLLYIIFKIKTEELQIERSLTIAEHLIENDGLLDFRMLTEKFRAGKKAI